MCIFEDRCKENPQAVIQDMLKQATAQAKAIRELNVTSAKYVETMAEQKAEIERLKGLLDTAGISSEPVKKARRTKKTIETLAQDIGLNASETE